MVKRTVRYFSVAVQIVRMGSADATSGRDSPDSLGTVHRSRVRAIGVVLWALAVISIAVVGRYATVARARATIQESLVTLLQVVAVVILFVGLVSLAVRTSERDGSASRAG
jgi:hypothetical protein